MRLDAPRATCLAGFHDGGRRGQPRVRVLFLGICPGTRTWTITTQYKYNRSQALLHAPMGCLSALHRALSRCNPEPTPRQGAGFPGHQSSQAISCHVKLPTARRADITTTLPPPLGNCGIDVVFREAEGKVSCDCTTQMPSRKVQCQCEPPGGSEPGASAPTLGLFYTYRKRAFCPRRASSPLLISAEVDDRDLVNSLSAPRSSYTACRYVEEGRHQNDSRLRTPEG